MELGTSFLVDLTYDGSKAATLWSVEVASTAPSGAGISDARIGLGFRKAGLLTYSKNNLAAFRLIPPHRHNPGAWIAYCFRADTAPSLADNVKTLSSLGFVSTYLIGALRNHRSLGEMRLGIRHIFATLTALVLVCPSGRVPTKRYGPFVRQ